MSATIEGPPNLRERPGHRGVVAYLAFLGVIMAVGVDIALPGFDSIARTFGMSNTGGAIAPVGTSYFLGMAVGQLFFGPASDRFGRKPCLLAGIALAIVGAIGSALAPSFGLLLVARTVWGIGSAAPGVLRTTIARDLFDGDEMARVVSTVMAVFLLGPIFVPSIGQLLLHLGSWRTIFVAATAVAVIGLGWTLRFGETLRPEARRPFDLRTLLGTARHVGRSRVTVGYIIAQTFTTGAFVIFLGSSQPIIDQQYGRGDRFGLYFGIAGAFMAVGLLVNNRLIGRYGTHRMTLVIAVALVTIAVAGLLVMLVADGRPSFIVWFMWAATANAAVVLLSPMCSALALEPMGKLAGTASALLGFVTLAGGALLASVFDSLITTTVTPMAAGYTLYGALALLAIAWARRSAVTSSGGRRRTAR